jgi:parallel beta-helix repeat protein
VLAASLLVFGCGDDGGGGTGGAGATGGSGGAGGGVVPKTCNDIPDTSSYIVANAPPTSDLDCDETLTATGDNDHEAIITAIVLAGSNAVICLEAGEYDMGGTIDITTTPGLTLKGIGDSPDDVVLDYYADNANGCRGSEGIKVSQDNVTIENMWLKNTCANAVEQRNVDGSVMTKVRVSWDDRCVGPRALANCDQPCTPLICDNDSDNPGDSCTVDDDCPNGACKDASCSNGDSKDARLTCVDGVCANNMTANGAYGLYPTDCQNTLVEYCQVQGASDAGVYIGKCDGGRVENNVAYENVAGLEVENSLSVDASNNELFNNVGGLLALQQDISKTCDLDSDNPGVKCTADLVCDDASDNTGDPCANDGDCPNGACVDACPNGACVGIQTNSGVRLFDNEAYCNNHENFAQPGSAVSGIPVGTGALSFVGNGVEFFGNEITDNLTLGIGLASNILNCQLASSDCPPYNPGYDPYAKNIYIHDNLFTNNGTDPQGDFGDLFNILGFGNPGGPPVPDVLWDGYLEPGTDEAGICLGTDAAAAASSLVIGDPCQDLTLDLGMYVVCAITNSETDPADLLCEP